MISGLYYCNERHIIYILKLGMELGAILTTSHLFFSYVATIYCLPGLNQY